MSEQPELSKEKIADYKEAFSLFDKGGIGQVSTHALPMLVRSLNLNPTEDELQEIALEADPGINYYRR